MRLVPPFDPRPRQQWYKRPSLPPSMVEMGLNIKNEETCRLAAELARLTNTTKTRAVRQALRERLERETKRRGVEARLHAMRRSAERCAALVGPGVSSGQHGDMLYDERGLPK